MSVRVCIVWQPEVACFLLLTLYFKITFRIFEIIV